MDLSKDNKLKRRTVGLSATILFITCSCVNAADLYDEAYRPQFHFSAKQGWLNDPNGLVYLDGTYHLFYQHNPFGNGWGSMSWGHATSTDLVRWTEQAPAIVGDPSGVKFSGTAVIDRNNTAGLQTGGTPTMALFYTSVGSFDQRMAYSNDDGKTFRYYEGNPVLPSVSGADDRDPQVFWHEASNKWIQALWVAPHAGKPQSISFFGSPDLKNWSFLSETPNYFECPDFFELPVDGNAGNSRWVLYGASGRYQVGKFDGTSFVPDAPGAGMITQDYGAHFYAAQTFHDIPTSDGRRLQVAWMNGASYPGMPFNQQMSFPVELTLRTTPDGIRMFREPAEEIATLHGDAFTLSNVALTPGSDPLGSLAGDLFHIKTQIALGTASSVGFNIRGTQVRYDVPTQTLTAFGRSAPLAPTNGRIDLELLVDRSSLELFGGNGRVSMTSGFTPAAGNLAIDLFANGGTAQVVSLSAYELQSAWPAEQPTPSTGLIGRWKFNDPTRMAGFADEGGQNFTLANSGVTSGVAGRAGGAIDIDAGDYAFMPDHTAMNADSFSVSLWINPDVSNRASHVIGKANYTANGSWGLEQQGDGRLKFFVRSDAGVVEEMVTQQPVDAGAWRHTVASYNADLGRMELYIDGTLSASSENVLSGPVKFDNAPFMLGRRVVGSNPLDALDGKIDELQLYGSALTPGEIGFLKDYPGLAIDPTSYVRGPLKLQVNADTGSVAVVNSAATPTALKGYSILSNRASLNPTAWQSFDDRPGPTFEGWEEANPTPSALSEINVNGTYTFGPLARLQLGTPVAAFATPKFGVAVRNTEFAFEYIGIGGQVYHGNVEFIGARTVNNLQLAVDPASGQVVLANSSSYTVSLLGYTIESASGSLRPANGQWNSLADQGRPGVDEANASSNQLSELVPFAGLAVVLGPGQSLALGSAFNVSGSQDLKLEFYLATDPLAGDFNADGRVNAADLAAWKAGSGIAYTGSDLLLWQQNLGRTNPNAVPVIMNGVVTYQTITVANVVPEPTAAALVAVSLVAMTGRRKQCSAGIRA